MIYKEYKSKYEECERWLNLIIKGVKKVRRGTKNIKIGIWNVRGGIKNIRMSINKMWQ